MKAIKPLIILLPIVLTVCACKKDNDFVLKSGDTFSINKGCASVIYQSNIGKDSASAVDSIRRLYELDYTWLWADSILPQRLNVDFPHDNRLFWLLRVKEKYQPLPVLTGFDAVDSKGNHYRYRPCDD